MFAYSGPMLFAAAILGGYLLGSIPFGVIATRLGGAGCDGRQGAADALAHVEPADQPRERSGLLSQLGRGGGGLLHHGGVLLGHLIHLVDGGVDLVEACGLFLR